MNERVSFVCTRSAEIRKGTEISQSIAMVQANKEWKEHHNKTSNTN